MKREFITLVESTNKKLLELSNGVVSHIADDLGVSEEEVLQKASTLGIDIQQELSSEDISKIYQTFDVEEKEANAKAEAEIDAIYGKHSDGEDGVGGDFVLTFADADEYAEIQKEKRKGGISTTSKMDKFLSIVDAKLQRIEDIGKTTEFHDASFDAYQNAHKQWRQSNYENDFFAYRKGGVSVTGNEMNINMNMES